MGPNDLPLWIFGLPAIGSNAPGNLRTDPGAPDQMSNPAYEKVMRLNVLRAALIALALIGSQTLVGASESDLLNSVKRNPDKARSMCRSFRKMNEDGKSAYSKKATRQVAKNQNLSFQDAEILVTYVVGMHCPDVR